MNELCNVKCMCKIFRVLFMRLLSNKTKVVVLQWHLNISIFCVVLNPVRFYL